MKISKFNLDLLARTEEGLYRLRDEMSDNDEENSPINPLIDWLQDKQKLIKSRLKK